MIILIADDDEDDRQMTKEAFEESRIANELHFVEDGVYLMDYLYKRGRYAHLPATHRPGLILLDLNMPRIDGREALNIIKSDENLRSIPVTIFTTSKAEEDILKSYNLGVNCFITKPVTFSGLVEVVSKIGSFWLELVERPNQKTLC